MTTKTHATYIDLRERILFGDLKAGDPYSSSDMMRDYGIVVGMARRILVSMKVGGYLTRSGPSYVVSSFSHEQVEEWRIGLGSLVEIGALRMTLSGGQWLEDFTRYVEKNIRHVSIDDEDFFQAAIGLTNMVLGGPNSTLAAIVDQFIPQVFFRLLWMADFYSERRGYLVEASDRFRGLSSNGTENLHKARLQASSMPVTLGSRSGRSSPRATMSGMVKA
ncbi:hypothetical protein [Erythrobacter donghaensis]|uniref:hypothetical protein n=1 Tax=Erythrobacter donghaensis TaxID=267135 RepID=UPI0012D9FDDB|nr:hypothetical protein [Erythrobacter donghaensis]